MRSLFILITVIIVCVGCSSNGDEDLREPYTIENVLYDEYINLYAVDYDEDLYTIRISYPNYENSFEHAKDYNISRSVSVYHNDEVVSGKHPDIVLNYPLIDGKRYIQIKLDANFRNFTEPQHIKVIEYELYSPI